ncbi:MAG: cysteine desulfurase [Planctomycetota bacterium]|nr:cysteine desulfurase [Planctomycetota bacterium]
MSAAPTKVDASSTTPFDVERIRSDFPILSSTVNGSPLVYLDNAATSQKPQVVIDSIREYYETTNANIHRGVHRLSVQATDAYEKARRTLQRFIGAERAEELIFVRGATEGINLVAQAWGRSTLTEDDEVLITCLEHHSNIVPWQLLCEQTGATLVVAPINDDGEILVDEFQTHLSENTKIVALAHVSNALGTINPVKELIALAHKAGAKVLIDGAQAAPHMTIDVQDLGCDFYAFTGHKMLGPTGIGILWGRHELLEAMSPYQGGGEMIRSVSFEKTTYNDIPHKFEAGTPNIVGAIGLGVAADYLLAIGLDRIATYEHELLTYGTERLLSIPGLSLIGTAQSKASILSFVMEGADAYSIGTMLDEMGMAVRTGHHCAEPVMARFGVDGTVRASLALYNTREEIDALVEGLIKVRRIFDLSE